MSHDLNHHQGSLKPTKVAWYEVIVLAMPTVAPEYPAKARGIGKGNFFTV